MLPHARSTESTRPRFHPSRTRTEVRPRVAIPVHGEARHLAAHAALAAECQVPEQILCENGDLVRLAPGKAEVVGKVTSGRLVYDGRRLLPSASPILRNRQKTAVNGAAFLTLVLDDKGSLDGDPELSLIGLIDPQTEDEAFDALVDAVIAAVERLPRRSRKNDEPVIEAARQALRRTANKLFGKKPVTEVHLVRFD